MIKPKFLRALKYEKKLIKPENNSAGHYKIITGQLKLFIYYKLIAYDTCNVSSQIRWIITYGINM